MIKLIVIVLFISLNCLSFATEVPLLLKNINFDNGLLHWQSPKALKDTAFSVVKEKRGNILKISGGPKENYQLVQVVNIPSEKLLNKRVKFFATVKVEQLSSGAVHLMIREINSKGKTIRYRVVKITKWSPKGWQKYNISLEVKNPTKKLQIYIKSNYLINTDLILLKDLELKVSKP